MEMLVRAATIKGRDCSGGTLGAVLETGSEIFDSRLKQRARINLLKHLNVEYSLNLMIDLPKYWHGITLSRA